MSRFKASRDMGSAYLLAAQNADGSVGSPQLTGATYYTVPVALQVSGHTHAASRLLDWARKSEMTPEGDFGPTPAKREAYNYAYYNSWIIVGAHRLGQFDMSQRGMDFLLRFWDRQSGAFYSSPTERAAETKQDLWVVSGCGRAAVATGRIEVARAVGGWMRTLMEAQPNYPRQMYTVYSRAVGLYTEPDPGDDERRYVLSQDATRDQYFFHPGIAGGFLSLLHLATGEQEWLDLAKEYMRFAEGASDYLFSLKRAGKVAWAASLLYRITGEAKYRDMAIRIGDIIIALQDQDGWWAALGETYPPNYSSTSEMVCWMDEIHQAVGED